MNTEQIHLITLPETESRIKTKNTALSYFLSLGIHFLIAAVVYIFWRQYIPIFHETKSDPVHPYSTFEVTTTSFTAMKSMDIAAYGHNMSGGEFSLPQNQLTVEPQMENPVHLEVAEPSLLPDIKPKTLTDNLRSSDNIATAISGANNSGSPGISTNHVLNASELPSAPRQTVEVFPEMAEKSVKGTVSLSLRIGLDGRVKEYKIVKNTIDCTECLRKIIEAAQKSRWEKATFQGNHVEYWIDKSYIFN